MRLALILLFLICVLFVPNFVEANGSNSQKAPKSAFSKFPLKGLVNASTIISSNPYSRARYRVTSDFQLICKARIVVTNYPPRYTGDSNNTGYVTTTTSFISNSVFDAMDITIPGKNSANYVSPDVVCGSYEEFYYLWKSQSLPSHVSLFLQLYGIAQLRYESSRPWNGGSYKAVWCRAITVGLAGNLEYSRAVFRLNDRKIYYYSDLGSACTRSWGEVQKWQRQGWYLIQ